MKPLIQHLILTNAEAMMTGVWRIRRAHDLVTLEYTDGSCESALITPAKWAAIHHSTFRIVSEVQSQRRAVHAAAISP